MTKPSGSIENSKQNGKISFGLLVESTSAYDLMVIYDVLIRSGI